MTTETQIDRFDCIAFKRQIQQEMLEEYEANRDEFETYEDYIRWSSTQPTGNPKFDVFIREAADKKMSLVN
jgi:hypothetical protein